ncbi:MAG: hypothetical protein WB808_05245 [Candidatus Dormiibacterota bacterium]
MTRAAHLVGSMPGDDADDAMRLAVTHLGPKLRSLPDGETGDRHNWIIHIIEGMRTHPDLELKKDGDWSDYDKIPVFRVRRGHTLRPETLDFGHVTAFEANWPAFLKVREEQQNPALAFQSGVPGDLDMALFTLGPLGVLRHRSAFRRATLREIREIHRRGGKDVVFQIEIPAELAFVARTPGPLRPLMARLLGRGVARLARQSPAGARFGIHLCLGDMNHRALASMPDTAPVVLLANAIVKAWPAGRPLEFIHAPFAAAEKEPRTDPAWYAPLQRLKLPGTTRFAAGFVHEDQDLEVQRQLRSLIEGNVGREVDVSTSCGLGRRTRPAAMAALERTAALTGD